MPSDASTGSGAEHPGEGGDPAPRSVPFGGLIEGAPDAVVGVGASGRIEIVNRATEHFFGYTREELIGQPLEVLIPERFRQRHEGHRQGFFADSQPRPMGTGLNLFGQRKDGSEFPIDVSLHRHDGGSGPLVFAFVRDVSERMRLEQDARSLRDHEIARAHALEINDVVVQGLATVIYALEASETKAAVDALQATMRNARQMMGDLLGTGADGEEVIPGSLLRDHPARVLDDTSTLERPTSVTVAQPRVLIADDTEDLRLLLRMALTPEFDVVAEAADGRQAIDRASELQPDIALLDLAMPVVDGLQAIPQIRRVSPSTRIIVLSGYGAEQMAAAAMSAGADAYLEKGTALADIRSTMQRLLGVTGATVQAPMDPVETTALDVDVPAAAMLAHELATPITVLRGVVETLRGRIHEMPSAMVGELLDAMARNVDHLDEVQRAVTTVGKIRAREIDPLREDLDVLDIVRTCLADVQLAGAVGRSYRTSGVEQARAIADPSAVRQVLANLLSNAAKYGESGAPIDVVVDTGSGWVAVSVTNAGKVIPESERERIFDPFVMGNSLAPGMGLGLFIARGLARAQGGDVRLDRSDAEGTTFTLSLPSTPRASD